MTKKDYEAAARIVARHYILAKKQDSALELLAVATAENSMVEFFLQDNPRFDEARFREACKKS